MVDDGDLRLSFLFRRLIQPKHWPTVLDRLLRADGMTDQQLKRTLDTGALQIPEPAHRRAGSWIDGPSTRCSGGFRTWGCWEYYRVPPVSSIRITSHPPRQCTSG